MKPYWYDRLPWADIDEFAKAYQLDRDLIAAVIMGESSGDKFSIRVEPKTTFLNNVKKFAKENGIDEFTETILQNSSFGYMHILGATARDYGYTGPLVRLIEADMSLYYGCRMLKHQLNRYQGSIEDAISAYNSGTVTKSMDGVYSNQKHVSRVMRFFAELKSL